MKFRWTDDPFYSREYHVGANIVGLTHEGKRPSSVELTSDELVALTERLDYTMRLCCVLSRQHQKKSSGEGTGDANPM